MDPEAVITPAVRNPAGTNRLRGTLNAMVASCDSVVLEVQLRSRSGGQGA